MSSAVTVRRSALIAAMAIASLPWPALAQERGILFGRSRVIDEPSRPSVGDTANREARVYADARADLDADRLRDAQRKLELFVATYPQSALVDAARRDLQRVYQLLSSAPPSPVPSATTTILPLPGRSTFQVLPPKDIAPVALGGGAGPATLPSLAAPSASQPLQPGPLSPAIRMASEDFRQQAGDRVFFAEGSSDLSARGRVALEAQAHWLHRHPDVRVVIEGHADDQGSRDINRQLAEKRAEIVRLRLNDLGIPEDRMRLSSHGRNEPVADCAETHCKAQNRRVVTVIVHVPSSLGFDDAGRKSLGAAASAVGQSPLPPMNAPRAP